MALPAQNGARDGGGEATQEPDPKQDPNVVPRAPAEAMATIEMPAGYRLELVAHEPMIEEPSLAAWDGNGRMYVAEMRTYMQDVDGSGKFEPRSRISLLEDTDDDGVMDHHTVFADGLVLPRMILTMHEGILIRETNTLDLWWLKDTDGDGVSDWKRQVFEGGPRGGNLEHQPSGLLWAIDNRCYVTYTGRRYRWDVEKEVMVTEPVAGDGQWGLTQDDEGQLFYSRAGGEVPCTSFQQNPQYGTLRLPGEYAKGYVECWPIDEIPDVQGGPRRVREDNTLNHFTACCGQLVFRGDRLPADAYGDYFLPEPVGRLVRRSKVRMEAGVRVLDNAYDRAEFMRTKDANFRPVNMYTGPDGTMYVVDMYRGIIQEGNWVQKGSYLRGVVKKYGLDENIGRGRIYRVRHEDYERGPKPKMLDESPAELVAHLKHPNGWWRDEAQKLLVLHHDTSIVPALEALARDVDRPIARLHALWTLDGLGALDESLLLEKLADPDPRLRRAAVRIAERHLGPTNTVPAMLAAVRERANDEDLDVVLQVVRTAAYKKIPGHEELLRGAAKKHEKNVGIERTVHAHFDKIAKAKARAEKLAAERKRNELVAASMVRGEENYKMSCITCHGPDGRGAPVPGVENERLAPSLIGSPRALGSDERVVRILLHGMQGPVDGETYPGAMLPLATQSDAWIADALTYVRRSWGNKGRAIERDTVARIRKEAGKRAQMWTLEELRPFDPILVARSRWKVTASVQRKRANKATDAGANTHWSSGRLQEEGMWIGAELPYAVGMSGVELTARHARQSPGSVEVLLSEDGRTWITVARSGCAARKKLQLMFPETPARYLRVRLDQAREGEHWTVADLRIFGEDLPVAPSDK